jgi:gliding motility-associated-like protein
MGITVLPDQTIQLSWQAGKADLMKMVVQRSQDAQMFVNLQTIMPPFPSPIVMTYVDTTADPSQRNWFYRILATDSCGDTLLTHAAQSIYLKGKARPNFTNTLEWNNPDIENGSVITYAVFLQQGGWSFRAAEPTESWVDDITDLLATDGAFCYYVEAQGVLALPSGSATFVSASNIRCLKQFAIIYAPTAFVPDGTNTFFKPVITFGVEGTYRMSIYNRYGQLLMSTTDPQVGWDGTHNGMAVPLGVYAYVIEVQGPNNNIETRTGTVMLIR